MGQIVRNFDQRHLNIKALVLVSFLIVAFHGSVYAGWVDLVRLLDPYYLRNVEASIQLSTSKRLSLDVTLLDDSLDARLNFVEFMGAKHANNLENREYFDFYVHKFTRHLLDKTTFKSGEKFTIDVEPTFATYCQFIHSSDFDLSSNSVEKDGMKDDCSLNVSFESVEGDKYRTFETPIRCGLFMDKLADVERNWHQENDLSSLSSACRSKI